MMICFEKMCVTTHGYDKDSDAKAACEETGTKLFPKSESRKYTS